MRRRNFILVSSPTAARTQSRLFHRVKNERDKITLGHISVASYRRAKWPLTFVVRVVWCVVCTACTARCGALPTWMGVMCGL